MKFCKKCHRRIVGKLENANVKICECDMFHECDVSLEVVKTCLSYGNKKDVANIKRIAGLNLLGMSVTEKNKLRVLEKIDSLETFFKVSKDKICLVKIAVAKPTVN